MVDYNFADLLPPDTHASDRDDFTDLLLPDDPAPSADRDDFADSLRFSPAEVREAQRLAGKSDAFKEFCISPEDAATYFAEARAAEEVEERAAAADDFADLLSPPNSVAADDFADLLFSGTSAPPAKKKRRRVRDFVF